MAFSAEFTKALVEEVFKDDNGDGLHDAIMEAKDWSLTPDQLKSFFAELPSELQVLALQWGLSDTQFRDDVYTCLERGKIQLSYKYRPRTLTS